MASILERMTKNGSSWHVRLATEYGRHEFRTFRTSQEAGVFAHRRESVNNLGIADIDGGALCDFYNEKLSETLGAYLALELPLEAPDRPVIEAARQHCGSITNGDIDRAFVRSYWRGLRQHEQAGPFDAPAMQRHFVALRAACRWRAATLGLTFSDAPGSAKPARGCSGRVRERWLSVTEEAALINAADNMGPNASRVWRAVLALALETGARQGELLAATWSDFDLTGRIWRLRSGGARSRRAVPLSQAAIGALFMLRADGDDINGRALRFFPSRLVFANAFKRLTRAACVDDLHFHDLRQEARSRMRSATPRLSEMELERILGMPPQALWKSLREGPWRGTAPHLDDQLIASAIAEVSEKRRAAALTKDGGVADGTRGGEEQEQSGAPREACGNSGSHSLAASKGRPLRL